VHHAWVEFDEETIQAALRSVTWTPGPSDRIQFRITCVVMVGEGNVGETTLYKTEVMISVRPEG
jgi:hypothetical protein